MLHLQCDQIGRLFVQYLANCTNENLPNCYFLAKVGSKFCQILKTPTKILLNILKLRQSGEISTNLVTFVPIVLSPLRSVQRRSFELQKVNKMQQRVQRVLNANFVRKKLIFNAKVWSCYVVNFYLRLERQVRLWNL